MEQQQQGSQRKRRSLSRSPSLSRRSSLRGGGSSDKSSVPSTSSGITKSKSKRGLSVLASGATPGMASGSKKERWLLTRKTWRYMTDAVGNLLPEYHYGGGAGAGPAGKGVVNLRRGSSSAGSGSSGPVTSTTGASSYYGGTPTTTPTSSGYTSYSLASPPFRQSVPRSSICSSSGTVPLVEEEESTSLRAVLPGKLDLPAVEKHFQQTCSKENKFLLWTRNKTKGLSGPALREAKLKEKEKQALQQHQQGQTKGGKLGGLLRRRGEEAAGEYDEMAMAGGSGGPMHLTRSQSSSSSLMTMGGSSSAGGMRSGRRATQDLLDYFSPGEEDSAGGGAEDDDELLHLDDDADDYDEYDDDREEQPTIRRKSSTASSIVSMVSGGLAFFRHHHQQGKGKGQPQQQYSGALGTIFIRTIPSTGVQKYYRNSAVQTEPFPEEILVRLRLQFIHEEQQHGRLVLQQTPAQLQAQAQQQQQLRHVMTLPIDKSASSPAAGFPLLHGRASASSGSTVATSVMTASLTAVSSPPGAATAQASSAVAGESTTSSTAPTTAPPDQTDKKSEESGYSSASISDTVMRYLRMARKSSKADNKETIDKFKTVNYDRSLRYIKSKNVTVEEALEHEKNKALKAEQLKAGIVPTDDKPKDAAAAVPVAADTATPTGGPSSKAGTGKTAEPKGKKAATGKGKKTKTGKNTDKKGKESESSQTETVPGVPAADPYPSAAETQDDVDKVGATSAGIDSNATSTPQTPLSPTSTSAPPSSMYSSRSGSGSSSVPPMSPPPMLLASTEMMLQGSMILSGVTGGPVLQSASMSTTATAAAMQFQPPAQLPGFPPPPTLVGIGIQAGESLVHLLKNYNPSRKLSDLSISAGATPSDYSSLLESMRGASASPRYSIVSTGTNTSGPSNVLSSNSDSELFANAAAAGGQYFLRAQAEGESLVPVAAASMSAKHPSLHGSARNYSPVGVGTSMYDSSTAAMQSKLRQMKSGVGIGSGSTLTSTLKKSASSQPMLLRIDDSTSVRSPCPSPGNISSTSSTGSAGGILISHLGSSGAGHYGTSSFPSLASAPSPTSSHLLRHQHHSALGLYTSQSPSSSNPTPNFLSTSIDPSLSSTSLGVDMLSPGTGTSRKKHSTLTWATTTSAPSMSGSLPVVSTASSYGRGGSGGRLSPSDSAMQASGGSARPHASASTSPSNYSSLTSSASHFLSSFRSGRRKGSGESGKHSLFGSGDAGTSASSYFGLLGHGSGNAGSDKKLKHLAPSPSSSQIVQPGRSDKGEYSQFGSASSDALVMQKSKSSSSVFGHGGHGSGSGGAEKRGSTASTSSITLPNTHMSAGSRLMSKTRLFKSRSKSQSRVSSAGTCTWTPQGKCKWTSLNGRQITLQPTTVLHLSEPERATLQKVALAKLQALNLDVEIKIPKEKTSGTLQKPKRRPYLLKKKALSTGFFESGPKDGAKELGPGSGLVFGVSLSQCVANDKKVQEQQQQLDQAARVSPRDWEQSIPPNATSTTTIKRSQNGSRNSVSSVFEGAPGGAGKEEKEKPQSTGSSESLFWAQKQGSSAALDSLSSSSGDLLADQNIPSIDTSPIGSVPTIVTSCIKHLENYGLHTTGIFRVSTSLKRIRQLREEIDSGKVVEFSEDHSPHDVAALLKEFLRDLPEPLLCRDLYQAFLRTPKIRNRKLQLEAVQHLIQLLPAANRDTLASLLKFFAKVVENASDKKSKTGEVLTGNKMEAYSLATLIAPNILPCMPTEGVGGSNMDPNSVATRERRESIDVVNYMISNYRDLFEVSPELLDEVYVHMMDTHPEVVESILKQKTGHADDLGLDELETSSVFEGSECGEPADVETISFSKILPKREDILHRESGKDGLSDSRSDKREKSRHHHHRSHHASRDSDLDKQQSGGESDSSSTKSATRWFRRAKHGPDSSKVRTSSDSGGEQIGKGKKQAAEQQQQLQRRKDSTALYESKRANSLDSVSLKDPGTVNVITLTQEVFNPHLDQNLQVPDSASRRQSSPVLDSTGIIKASLKIPVPVPVSIDDTDIPFIEDDNAEVIQQHLHHHHHILRPHQPQLISIGLGHAHVGSADSRALVRHGVATTSNTPGSSQAASPLSSPVRPSSEASSPSVLSPPMSPVDDPSTFPYEEMTARFCIGAPGNSDAATSSSGSTSSSLHSGTTIVSKVPNIKAGAKPTETGSAASGTQASGSPGSVGKSSGRTQQTSSVLSPAPQPSSSSSITTPSEVKAVGKETKGANIAGLIKSKTADFEKIAKDSQTSPSPSQPSKIASSMRLRSQGNIQLKQQFLLRQQEKQAIPTASSNFAALTRSATEGRSLQRPKLGSSSSQSSSEGQGPPPTGPPSTSARQPPQHQAQSHSQAPSHAKPAGAGLSTAIGSGPGHAQSGASVSGVAQASPRWKRSEIIASRQTGSSPSHNVNKYL